MRFHLLVKGKSQGLSYKDNYPYNNSMFLIFYEHSIVIWVSLFFEYPIIVDI